MDSMLNDTKKDGVISQIMRRLRLLESWVGSHKAIQHHLTSADAIDLTDGGPTALHSHSKLRESDDGGDAVTVDASGNVTVDVGNFTVDVGNVTIGDGTGIKTLTIDAAAGQTTNIVVKNAGTQIGSIVVDKTAATPDREKMIFSLGASGYGILALQRNPGDEQLGDDVATTFSASGMNRFFITIATNGEEYCVAFCPYNNTITILHNSGVFNAVAGGGTLSGTTGTDGKINLRMSNNTLYIENRIGGARYYSLTVIGASS